MAEQKEEIKNDNTNSLLPTIARWDISVHHKSFVYSQNQRVATRATSFSDENYLSCRTVFLKEGRHIFNIKITRNGHNFGIGIYFR